MAATVRPWNKKNVCEHALAYASRGWFVFPSPASGEKMGCVSGEKTNGNRWGCTTDPVEIVAYYKQFPAANVGIATGKDSGIFVLEADTPAGHSADGIANLKNLEAEHGELPATLMAESPSGSVHRFFKYPSDGTFIENSASKLAPGVDVRGDGGMVIAAPSVRPGKGIYRWLNTLPIADAPEWLIKLSAKAALPPPKPIIFSIQSSSDLSAYGAAALADEMAQLAARSPGERNTEANLSAYRIGRLVGGRCLAFSEAYSALEQAVLSWGVSPKDKALGPKGTLARALRVGEKYPRGPNNDPTPTIQIHILGEDIIDADTGEIISGAEPTALDDYPDYLLNGPELINDIADWIMSTAMFPCRLFSVAAALCAVGAAVGRQIYTGTPRTGTALYWLTIAPTASGKERPQEAIKQIFEGAGLSHLVKSSVSSSAKLGVSLQEKPLQIQIIDEIGKVLRKFIGRNASTQELSLLDDYCTVWGKNLGSFSPEGVTTRGDICIKRPSLTLLGATTPVNFYKQLRSDQVAGGFLNRFIVLHRFKRMTENKTPKPEENVPHQLIDAIRTLHTFQDGIQRQSTVSTLPEHTPSLFVVPTAAEAEILLAEYRLKTRDMILKSDSDPIFEIWARAAEMVKRISLILACARHWRDMYKCEIQPGDVRFASSLIDWSMSTFMEGIRNHMAENEYQANSKLVLNLVREAGKSGITKTDLYRKIDGRLSARDIQGIIGSLSDSGSLKALEEKAGPAGGRPKVSYIFTRINT